METPPTNSPELDDMKEHDIYMHCSPTGRRIWRATANLSWEDAEFGMVHPTWRPKYKLHLSNDSWARWVQKKTLDTYKGRQKVHSV